VTFQVVDSLEFLFSSAPSHIIYTGRFSASVRRYAMHGQELGPARVSQEPLQGLRFAVLACLGCLGNTHLQPPDRLPHTGPLNGGPGERRRGERRISCLSNRHLLSFVADGSTDSLARSDQTDVGVSSALRVGVGFFGLPNAALPNPPCGEVCPVASRAEWAAFPCSTAVTMNDLGPLSTPAVLGFASGH